MPALLERIGLSTPIVQAGMGGGVSRHELAAAVSEAGGLGTIAVNGAAQIERELAAADAIITFWGRPRRRRSGVWFHQCGSVAEAQAAHSAGADAVIVQGVEAGGHVRGTIAAPELLERVEDALPTGFPLLLAGGIATREDVAQALDAGAAGAVAGTRFLLSAESRAHPEYKRRLLDAEQTVLTELFGLGWPAPHRVVGNEATGRQLRDGPRVPTPNRPGRRPAGGAHPTSTTPERGQCRMR